MFSATPTTYVHGTPSGPTRTHWPIGSRPGQSLRAIASLTTHGPGSVARVLHTQSTPLQDARAHGGEVVGAHRIESELAMAIHRVNSGDVQLHGRRAPERHGELP